MKRSIIAFLLVFLVQTVMAQITGEIIDDKSGLPVPYASAIYRGNKVAVASDEEGKFTIERHQGWRLTVSSVGYIPQVINITRQTPDHIVVRLKADTQQLSEVSVKSKRKSKYSRKDNPAVELMKKVIAAKKRTELKNHDFYQYNNYQKITLALNDLTEPDLNSRMFHKHQWLLNQIEVCQYNQKLILPMSVEETVAQK